MTRRTTLAFTAASLLCLGACPASAQSIKQQIVGTWTLAENYILYQDGRKAEAFGGDQKGLAMLDANGRFSWLIMGGGRKKFASNNRTEGTAEENKAAVFGSIAYYGTYTVDEATKTVTYNIDRSSFPNWDGTSRKANVTITGDEFKQQAAPIPSAAGTYVPHLVWKRVK